jgi:hypothetical protein
VVLEGLGRTLGDLGVERVLHERRQPAHGGGNAAQTLPEAIALHGKPYFNEVDTETHLKQRQWRWGDLLRNPTNLEETRGLLLQDFAYAFTKGFAMWYMELHGGAYPDPGIVQVMSQARQIDQKYAGAVQLAGSKVRPGS